MSDLPVPTASSKLEAAIADLERELAHDSLVDLKAILHRLKEAALASDDIADISRAGRLIFDVGTSNAHRKDSTDNLPTFNITILAGDSTAIRAERVVEPDFIEAPVRELPAPEPETQLLPPLKVEELPDLNAIFGLRSDKP